MKVLLFLLVLVFFRAAESKLIGWGVPELTAAGTSAAETSAGLPDGEAVASVSTCDGWTVMTTVVGNVYYVGERTYTCPDPWNCGCTEEPVFYATPALTKFMGDPFDSKIAIDAKCVRGTWDPVFLFLFSDGSFYTLGQSSICGHSAWNTIVDFTVPYRPTLGTPYPNYPKISKIYAGHNKFVAITDAGVGFIMGEGRYGNEYSSNDFINLGLADIPSEIVDMSLGETHALACAKNGLVYNIGTGTNAVANYPYSNWAQWYSIPNGRLCAKVSAGNSASLAIMTDGTMWVSGDTTGTNGAPDGLGISISGPITLTQVTLPTGILARQAWLSEPASKYGVAVALDTTSRTMTLVGWSGKAAASAASSVTSDVYRLDSLMLALHGYDAIPAQVSVENSHAVVRAVDGRVFSFSDATDVLALGTSIVSSTPRFVDLSNNLAGKRIIAMTNSFAEYSSSDYGDKVDVTFALADDMSLWTWGLPTQRDPVRLPHTLTGITQIWAGIQYQRQNSVPKFNPYVFALTTTGTLYVRGSCTDIGFCPLGKSGYPNSYLDFSPVDFPEANTKIVSVAPFGYRPTGTEPSNRLGVMAVDSLGNLWRWGYYDGVGYFVEIPTKFNVTTLTGVSPAPFLTKVWSRLVWPNDPTRKYITPSFFIQDNTGVVRSFGDNQWGQLCQAGASPSWWSALPINMTALGSKRIRDVAVGTGNTYIVTEDNFLFGCGLNDQGQLATLPLLPCSQFGCVGYKYPILIAPSASRTFSVKSVAVGESAILVYTTNDQIWVGGRSFNGNIYKVLDANLPGSFAYGRYLSAFVIGQQDRINVAAPLTIFKNTATQISTLTFYTDIGGLGFASTSEGEIQVTLSSAECTIRNRNYVTFTCLLSSDPSKRPTLVPGPLMANLTFNGETVGPVQIATVLPDPVVFPSALALSEKTSVLTISGTNFGYDPTVLHALGCGPVLSASDTSLTCQITSAISAAQGVMKVKVLRHADPALAARFVEDVIVATVIAEHEITGYLGIVPRNAQRLQITGREFNSSIPFSAQLSIESGSIVDCVVSDLLSSSFVCTVAGGLPGSSGARITAFVTQAGYNASKSLGYLGHELTSNILTSDQSTFASNARLIGINGAGFGDSQSYSISIDLISGYAASKRAQSTFGCDIVFRNDSRIECRPQETLLPGPLIASFSTNIGLAASVSLGQVVAAPSVDATASFQKLATTANSLRIIGNGFASGNETSLNVISFTNFPQKSCTVVAVSNTSLTCSLTGPAFSTGLVLQASVTVFGGLAGVFPAAIIVNPPKVTVSAEKILIGTDTITIRGEGFDPDQPSTSNSVELRINSGDAFPCIPIDSQCNDTYIVCSLANSTTPTLPVIGALTASVTSYGGVSESTQVGLIVEPTTPGTITNVVTTGVEPAVIGGAVAAVAALMIIAAVVILIVVRRRMRLLKNIEGMAVEVPKEMASMFNIKSDSLTIIRRLGEGSFGAVFLAKNASGKLVAVKKLAGTMMSTAATDFFREAALMTSIPPHKNVVRIYGLCQEMNNFSLVMEYLKFGSLDSYVSKLLYENGQQWDLHTQYRVVLGIARGMAHLAAQGLVHRDLAARNILLGGGCEPKISDFGMSRIVGNEAVAQTKADVGPIKWMPPESIRDRVYSEKSDVWSFGVTLFEIVEGREPYGDMELLQIAVSVRDSGLTVLSLLPQEGASGDYVPEYLRRLMEQCCQQDPANRPSFSDIVTWLEQCTPVGYTEYVGEDVDDEPIEKASNKKRKTQHPSQNVSPTEVLPDETNSGHGTNYGDLNV